MIYFVRPINGGRIKIGTTVRLSERIVALRAEFGRELEVLAVTDGGRPEESALHHRFSHLCAEGEWFEPGDDLLAFILHDAHPWDGEDESPAVKHTSYVPERIRRGLNIRAARLGVSVGQLILELVEANYPEDLDLADKAIAQGESGAAKRGRKPKAE